MKIKKMNNHLTLEEMIKNQKRPLSFPKKPPQKPDLKNIMQVTQENQQPNNNIISIYSHQTQHNSVQKITKITCCDKFVRCFSFLWRKIINSQYKNDFDINDEDFAAVVTKLRNKKSKFPSVIPGQKQFKKVLVLDLDETLVHTTFTRPLKYDLQLQVIFNGRNTKIYTIKRFGLDSFLFQMSKIYEIIIYTASQKLYADKVIDLIDPKKRISHRLYREHCIIINKTYFLKNLKILGRNINDIVLVDDNSVSGILHPDNFYKIQPFTGNQKDRQLFRLSSFLKHLHEQSQILPIRQGRRQFEEMQIILSEQDTSSTLKKTHRRNQSYRKKQYGHKKTNSQIQTLCNYEDNKENIDIEFQTTASSLAGRGL